MSEKNKEYLDNNKIISRKKRKIINNECAELEEDLEEKNLFKEKEDLLKRIKKWKRIKDKVALFGKIMDDYGADAIVGLIPELWDAGSSIISTMILLYRWQKIWLSSTNMLKIVWYQTTDVLVWAVPVLWDIADYFFKANKRSAEIFDKHFESLKKEAIRKGIDKETIEKIENDKNIFIHTIWKIK